MAAALLSLSAAFSGDGPCAGWPCFTPNPKDVHASSLRATCGPLVGNYDNTTLELCQARPKTCHYNFTFYTCDQGALDSTGGHEQCLQGSFDKCNVLCLELDPPYFTACNNHCKRACGLV